MRRPGRRPPQDRGHGEAKEVALRLPQKLGLLRPYGARKGEHEGGAHVARGSVGADDGRRGAQRERTAKAIVGGSGGLGELLLGRPRGAAARKRVDVPLAVVLGRGADQRLVAAEGYRVAELI